MSSSTGSMGSGSGALRGLSGQLSDAASGLAGTGGSAPTSIDAGPATGPITEMVSALVKACAGLSQGLSSGSQAVAASGSLATDADSASQGGFVRPTAAVQFP